MAISLPNELNHFLRKENTYLVPSRVDKNTCKKLIQAWKSCNLTEHAFITSSGTTSSYNIKSYALSYDAIKANANSVNRLLKSASGDRWLSSLPIYHIGGLSIYARAILSQSEVVSYHEKWNPLRFARKLFSENIQFCSIVPTQLYDLINEDIKAPASLKAIFVGGDYTPRVLFEKAIKLGWPVYLTFGMTEVCSQLATSTSVSFKKSFPLLDIHEVKIIDDILGVKSKALFTKCFIFENNSLLEIDQRYKDGYFLTNDRANILKENGITLIEHLGRVGDEVKINSRLVNLLSVKNKFSDICDSLDILTKAELVVVDHERSGKAFEIWIEKEAINFKDSVLEQLQSLNIKVEKTRVFEKLARNHLGKLLRNL